MAGKKKPFTEPVTFQEATAYIETKVDRPTYLKSRQIAALWDAETKQRAFFSARVANADILSELHRRVQRAANGDMTQSQARELLRVWLQGDGKDLLASLGFSPPNIDSGLSELGSVRRLELILYQNTKMAQEVGHYQQWSEVSDIYQYGIWRIGNSEEHRVHHVARDGMCFHFTHPVWTQDPPGGEYNCRCWREEITTDEASRRGLVPQLEAGWEDRRSPLGFDPSLPISQDIPAKASWPPEIRAAVRASLCTWAAIVNATRGVRLRGQTETEADNEQ